MRFLPNGQIQCSTPHMVKVLEILAYHPHKFDYLLDGLPSIGKRGSVSKQDFEVHGVWMSRSGAKLHRQAHNRWTISRYSADGRDGESLIAELKSGHYQVLAIEEMKRVEQLGSTAREYQIQWRGLFGTYPSGQRTPGELNWLPAALPTPKGESS